jgi:putative ABC transport system permease protein
VTLLTWVIRSLIHYRRMHLAVALAAATATATLTGALLVGDSVRATLRYAFDTRLGNVSWVLSTQERFFTEGLSRRLEKEDIDTAPVLMLRGMVTRGDGAVRVNQLHVLGVDDRFFDMSLAGNLPAGLEEGTALVNAALAARLKIKEDNVNELILRIDNPAAISRNLVLAPFKDSTISMRLPVTGVADDMHFGRFSLEANQQEPLNLFVPIAWLQKQINRGKQANLLLINGPSRELTADILNQALNSMWRLEDAEAELEARGEHSLELNSSRVFLDHSLGRAALKTQPNALRLLTYFVNELRVGHSSTPYSMVTAADREGGFIHILPQDMKDDQIVINQWLADDLNAGVGDLLTLKFFVPSGWQTLEEAQRSFTVCRIMPLEGTAADQTLMPDLPGLSDSENCSDWDPSLPIDLDRIRDKDETYWDNYRGTPKAFVTLAAGQAMWANSYGDLTAVRFKADLSDRDKLAESMRRFADPASVGLSLIPVSEIGKRASKGGTDFGQLFLGLSMFLIVSGILLTWLLFVFSIEGRKDQTGMLLAIGFPVKRIRKLYLSEGLFIALFGALVGTFIALAYTRLLIWGLSNAWQGAVAGMTVHYSASIQSLSIGLIAGFLIALMAMTWTLHRQMKFSAHSLLTGSELSDVISSRNRKRRWAGWVLSIISFTGAVLLIIMSKSLGSSAMAGAFFGAGSLLLISLMIWFGMMLGRMGATSRSSSHSLVSLALRNSARRRGRSLAVIAMLACGVFMVVAVSANRKDPTAGAKQRASGTGGFSLYAESSVPIVQDLSSVAGRSSWGMNPATLEGTRFVNLRVRDGDDASCLNLNRAQSPRILGVSFDELAERGAFSFQEVENNEYQDRPWNLLDQDLGDRVIPAVGDYPTVFWGLGKKIGDILIYPNRKGEEIQLRIVGMIRSSIMQGNLIISEEAMARYFPEVEGYRAWLIDTPPDRKIEISEHLTRRMADAGLSVETTVERLEVFARVEDTYLSIFLVLGGLGLMLGCIGLGLIVARNLLERQGELAMLRALGFNKHALLRMVCYEHLYLLAAGLLAGLICAIVSVTPSIRVATGQLPFVLLTIMTLMIGISGVFWVVISTGMALRGAILTPLRNE